MMVDLEAQYRLLQQQIYNSLQKADIHKDKLQRINIRYSILNIVLGAMTTFVTGQAALAGEEAAGRWRITCAIASGFALSATVVASVQSHSTDDLEQVKEKYQQILSEFSNIDC
jgi:hypothetical protein